MIQRTVRRPMGVPLQSLQAGTGTGTPSPERAAIASPASPAALLSGAERGVGAGRTAPQPVPADVIHARTEKPWRDWSIDELARFVRLHPYAIASRTFEYQRGGFPLVDVTVPCIHWLDTLGHLRITALDYGVADGLCTMCADEPFETHGRMEKGRWPQLDELCSCGGTKVAPVALRLGVTFMETQDSQWYWKLTR